MSTPDCNYAMISGLTTPEIFDGFGPDGVAIPIDNCLPISEDLSEYAKLECNAGGTAVVAKKYTDATCTGTGEELTEVTAAISTDSATFECSKSTCAHPQDFFLQQESGCDGEVFSNTRWRVIWALCYHIRGEFSVKSSCSDGKYKYEAFASATACSGDKMTAPPTQDGETEAPTTAADAPCTTSTIHVELCEGGGGGGSGAGKLTGLFAVGLAVLTTVALATM